MMRISRPNFVALRSGVAALALIAPAAALAQSLSTPPQEETSAEQAPAAAQTDDSQIEEIVVTAERRSANLQDVPIAISAFSGDALEERGINDVAGLQSYVPNLRIGEEQNNSKISLRGIGLQGTSSLSDSGVAFYIDNFYIPRPAGGSAVFYDVDRIEVLRGPQGTLYGRNATGGVVNVISKRPRDRFEGEIGASYGSRNLFELRGVLNAPLATDVAARLSAVYTQEDGYVENDFSGQRDLFGSEGDITARAQILAGTPDTVEFLISGTYSKQNGSGIAQQYLERNIGGPPPTQALLRRVPAEDPDPLVTSNNISGYNDTETYRVVAQLTKDFGAAEAVLQAGKQWQKSDLYQDFDGSSVDVSELWKNEENRAESLEFRLNSTSTTPFSWIVGGYYFSEETYIFRRVQLKGLNPAGVVFTLPDFLLDENGFSETLAAFGSATYSILPTLRVTGGVRYTEDEKRGTKVTRGNFGQPFPPDIPNAAFPGRVKFEKLTWRGGVEWDVADRVLAYANISNGYKAGGFNVSSNGSPYDPETITAYEVGVKSDLFDRRVRLNVDAFYYDYKDLQLTTLLTINNAPGQFTTNAAATTIYGVELETQFKVTPALLLSASYAYTNAEFDDYFNTDPRAPARGRLDLSGNKVPYVSENTVNLGAQYNLDLGSAGGLTASVNFNWHDELFLREYNDPLIDRVGANTKTDITVTYAVADTGLRLTGYVSNLENDVEKNNIYVSPGFVGLSATTAYTRPRTIGLRADYKF